MKTKLTYFLIMHVERRFGGPEEGGWWYNRSTPSSDQPKAIPTDKAIAFGDRVQQLLDTLCTCNQRELSSVLSEGRYEVSQFDTLKEAVTAMIPEPAPTYE